MRNLFCVGLAILFLCWPMRSSEAGEERHSNGPDRFEKKIPDPTSASLDGLSEIPEFIVSPTDPHQPPLFVSADRVFEPHGEVDTSLFTGPTARSIQRVSEQMDQMGCQTWWHSGLDSRPTDYLILEDSLESAELIVVGTVTGYRQGFFRAQPGTILRLHIDKMLKGSMEGVEKFVFFPVGDFHAGSLRICIKNETFPPLPQLGDTLLVQLHPGPDPDLEFWPLGAASFIAFQDGKAHLPKFFQLPEKQLSSEKHFMTWIRAKTGVIQ